MRGHASAARPCSGGSADRRPRADRLHDRIDDAGFLRHHDPHFPRPRRIRDLAAAFGAGSEDRHRTAAASIPSPAAIRRPAPGQGAPSDGDNVVRLARGAGRRARRGEPPRPPAERWKGIAEPGTPHRRRARRDRPRRSRASTPPASSRARKAAYEMIVTAFAQGDRRTLKDLLSKEVYEGFEPGDRRARAARREGRDDLRLHRQGRDRGRRGARRQTAQVVLRFLSKLITATRDAAGKVVDGSPDAVVDVTDVWTFARDPRQPRPQLAARRDRSGAMSRARRFSRRFRRDAARDRRRPSLRAGRTRGSSRSPFRDLAGWAADDHAAAFRAFRRSCGRILAAGPDVAARLSARMRASSEVCREALAARADRRRARPGLLRDAFQPFRGQAAPAERGFLTGYYEPEFEGSRDAVGRPSGCRSWPGPTISSRCRRASDCRASIRASRRRRRTASRLRALSRSRRDRGRRAGRARETHRLPARAGRGLHHSCPGLGPHPPSRRRHAARRLCGSQRPSLYVDRRGSWCERGEMPLETMTLERLMAWLRDHPEAAAGR